jgi:hypothetical protein
MNAGTLNFTLGLASNQFLGALRQAGGELAGFIGLTASVGAAFGKMWGAIERGGQLYDASRKSGVGVGALYQVGEALKQIGENADGAMPLMMKLQRTLAGQEGQSVLRSLGLDPKGIAGSGAEAQIMAIAGALGKMNGSAQASAAFSLFGREGGGTMLAITRSADDFADAMGASARDSEVWARNAERFDAVGDRITAWQGRMNTMFAEAAAAVMDIADVIQNAIAETRYFELLGAGFSAVFDYVGNLGAAFLNTLLAGVAKFGEDLVNAMAPAGAFMSGLAASLNAIKPGAGNILMGASSVLGIRMGMGSSSTYGALANAAQQNAAGSFDAFLSLWNSFRSPAASGRSGGGPAAALPEMFGKLNLPVGQWERMGAVFGGGNPVLDAQRQANRILGKIEANTRRPTGPAAATLTNS